MSYIIWELYIRRFQRTDFTKRGGGVETLGDSHSKGIDPVIVIQL